jgi:hypothetical protein
MFLSKKPVEAFTVSAGFLIGFLGGDKVYSLGVLTQVKEI